MTLADYLAREAITTEEFARRVDVDRVSVCRYLRGRRRPHWDVMQRIIQETEGHVMPNDFVEVPKEVRARRRAA